MIRISMSRIVRRYLRASILEEGHYKRMILAGRIDDLIKSLKKKNPQLTDQIDFLVENDPTGRQKHLAWSVLQVKKKENPKKILDAVKRFEALLKRKRIPNDKKDLSKRIYPTLETLTTLVQELEATKSEAQKRKTKRQEVYSQTDFVKLPRELSERYFVAIPKSTKASCYIGKGTRWCTSAREDNQFESYTHDNIILYYTIDKERKGGAGGDPFSKVAFALPLGKMLVTIFDAEDKALTLNELPEEHQRIYRSFIQPYHSKLKTSPIMDYVKEQHAELAQKIRQGIRPLDLKGVNLSGADLSGADLSGLDLEGVKLIGATLKEANLMGVDLSGADLSGTNLSETLLAGANLRGASLYRAEFKEADLRGADLTGANLSRANLRRSDLTGATLNVADLSGANLRWADLTGAYLSMADLSRALLNRADLTGADLIGTNLSGASLYRADLNEAFLYRTDLNGADLIGANLTGAKFAAVDYDINTVWPTDFDPSTLE